MTSKPPLRMISMASFAEPSKKSIPRIRWVGYDVACVMLLLFFHSTLGRGGAELCRSPECLTPTKLTYSVLLDGKIVQQGTDEFLRGRKQGYADRSPIMHQSQPTLLHRMTA